MCPFDHAWIDRPDVNGKFHKYAECAGNGICNRDTGECLCLDGFEGKACQRTSCPNACSGHGTCEYIDELSYASTWNDYSASYFNSQPKTFAYLEWDSRKNRGCVCDALYGDVDCSKRLCPYGTDVLDTPDNLIVSDKWYKQKIDLMAAISTDELEGKTFALTFKSKINETFTTIPIVFKTASAAEIDDFVTDIQLALLNLPNRVIDGVKADVNKVAKKVELTVTYTGSSVQGPQNYLVVEAENCDFAGCTPRITGLNLESRQDLAPSNNTVAFESPYYQSYECGRRGKCDYTTGLCRCYLGYTGDNCDTLTTLA